MAHDDRARAIAGEAKSRGTSEADRLARRLTRTLRDARVSQADVLLAVAALVASVGKAFGEEGEAVDAIAILATQTLDLSRAQDAAQAEAATHAMLARVMARGK